MFRIHLSLVVVFWLAASGRVSAQVVAWSDNNLSVTETVTDIGGGQWQYDYELFSDEPGIVWHFFVWPEFQIDSMTNNSFPNNTFRNNYNAIADQYVPLNIDPDLVSSASMWHTPFAGQQGLMLGETGSLTIVASVLDTSPKWYGYETDLSGWANVSAGGFGAGGSYGQIHAIGLTVEVAPDPEGPAILFENGILSIFGTGDDNEIMVMEVAGTTSVVLDQLTDQFDGVDEVLIKSRAGDDQVTIEFSGPSTVFAGSGDDIIVGGNGADTIRGGGGRDVIDGFAGDDVIFGGQDGDMINGGIGNDTISGGPGQDFINGGLGEDELTGGTGTDTIQGGGDNDTIFGSKGPDQLIGGDGDDAIFGGLGRDTISGGPGNDNLDGQADNDIINGGDGDDTLTGGSGSDQLNGGSGIDTATDSGEMGENSIENS